MDATQTAYNSMRRPVQVVRCVAQSVYERANAGMIPTGREGGVLVGWTESLARVYIPFPPSLEAVGIDEDALVDYLATIEPEASVDLTVDLPYSEAAQWIAEDVAADLAALLGARRRVSSRCRKLNAHERRAARMVEYV